MSAIDGLKNDINNLENQIDEIIYKIEITGFYSEYVAPKEKRK